VLRNVFTSHIFFAKKVTRTDMHSGVSNMTRIQSVFTRESRNCYNPS